MSDPNLVIIDAASNAFEDIVQNTSGALHVNLEMDLSEIAIRQRWSSPLPDIKISDAAR
jgi:hypothetical protein